MRGRHNHLLILPAVADLPERINMGGVILLGFVKNGVHRTQLFVVQAVRFLDCSIHDVVHRRIQLMDSSHFVDLCSSAFSTSTGSWIPSPPLRTGKQASRKQMWGKGEPNISSKAFRTNTEDFSASNLAC